MAILKFEDITFYNLGSTLDPKSKYTKNAAFCNNHWINLFRGQIMMVSILLLRVLLLLQND
jgi:hypothetical protein